MKSSSMALLAALAYLAYKSGMLGGGDGSFIGGSGGGASGGSGGGATSGADIDLTPTIVGVKTPDTKSGFSKKATDLTGIDYKMPITSRTYRELQRSTGTMGVQVLTGYAKARYPGLTGIPNISFNTARIAAAGQLHESTYQSIVGAQAVREGRADAYDYAGGAAAMPGVSREGYNYAVQAHYQSPTYRLQQQVRTMNQQRAPGTSGWVVRNGQIVSRGY